ncbi:uncharacterized protein MONOS_17845 [Monocercomonoides exilis]|uniref:uncharacterized protein n=1 Tax=Monocercomonoides exilis TaxID=2049356 RepID=UPI003559A74A|nr:hypothetical protein MONOS_17845 [Monocercomonoides exilis]
MQSQKGNRQSPLSEDNRSRIQSNSCTFHPDMHQVIFDSINSTLCLRDVQVTVIENTHIAQLDELSMCSFCACVIDVLHLDVPPFDVKGGLLEMKNCLLQPFGLAQWQMGSLCSCEGSCLFLGCTSFSSFCVAGSKPLIGSCRCEWVRLDNCHFRNITWEGRRDEQGTRREGGGKSTTACGCSFEEVWNPINGGILADFNAGGSTSVFNSTFFRCKQKYSEGKMERITNNETVSFENVEWNSIKTGENAGALCEANACGGGICLCKSIPNLEINNCSFAGCIGRIGGGGLMVGENVNSNIHETIIRGCTTQANIGGGGVILRNYMNKSSSCSVDVEFCFFESNTGNNGDLSVRGCDVYGSRDWNGFVKEGDFRHCVSVSEGAVKLYLSDLGDKSKWLEPCHNPIVVSSSTGTDHVTCGHGRDEGSYAKCRTIGFTVGVVRGDGETVGNVSVEEGEYYEEGVRIEGKRLRIGSVPAERKGVVHTRDCGGWLFWVGNGWLGLLDLAIVDDGAEGSSSGVCCVSGASGQLEVSGCEISGGVAGRVVKECVMEILEGEAVLRNSSMRDLQMDGKCAVWVNRARQMRMEEVNMTSMGRVSGSGAVVEGVLSGNGKMAVSGVVVEDCSAMCGNGGWMNAEQRDGSECANTGTDAGTGRGGGIHTCVAGVKAEYGFKNVEFVGNEAAHGKDVFVVSPLLGECVMRERFGFFSVANPFGEECAEGVDTRWGSVVIPLVYYLKEREGKVSVGNNGHDVPACGFYEYECLSVGYSKRQAKSRWDVRVKGRYDFVESVRVVPGEELMIGGVDGEECGMVMKGDGSGGNGMVEVSGTGVVAMVELVMEEGLKGDEWCVFHVEGSGDLSVDECRVCGDGSVEKVGYGVFCVSGGGVTVTNVVLDGLGFTERGFVEVSGETAEGTIVGLNVTGGAGSRKGVIVSKGAKKMKVKKMNASGVCVREGCGAVMEAVVKDGCRLTVDGSVLEGVCEKGDGGGMMVVMEGGGRVEVGKSESVGFEGCSAQRKDGAGGHGGGLMMRMEGSDGDFKLERLRFSGCQASVGGRNVFVCGEDFSREIERAKFGFVESYENTEEIGGYEDGDETWVVPVVLYLRDAPEEIRVGGERSRDFGRCGYEGFECQSVDYGVGLWGRGAGVNCVVTSPSCVKGEMVLEEGEYRIRGMGMGSEVEMMQSEGTGAEGTVESSAQVTIEKVVFVAPAQKKAKDALIHTTGGEINIRLCSVGVCSGGSSEQSRELKHTFLRVSGGRLVLEEFELTAIAAASVPVVVVEDSGCGTIEQCLFSGVGKAHADGLILCDAQGVCEVSNTTMSGLSLSEGCGICDRGGKNMVVRNCTMSEVTTTKGNGCCVVGCWTERGNGGGIHVEMEGDGCVQVGKVGKVGMKTLFEGCCARDGNEIGGYGGGVALVSKGNLSSFVVADVVFGVNEKANHASKGGDNVFVRGENLSRLITDESMQFEFDRETKATFRELEGEEVGEGGEVSAFVPLAVFVVEFRGSVHVGGESGVDYRMCGLEVYPCSTIGYGCALRFGAAQASVRLMPTFVFNSKLTLAERSIEFEAAVAEEAIQIDTSGIGAEGWLVETSSTISFSRIHFSVSSSGARCSSAGLNQHTDVAAERAEHEGTPNTGGHKCVFVCAGSSLTICSCSVRMKTADAVLDAQLIRCVGGTLSISGLSMSSVTTREPLVVIDGDECAGVMEGLEIYGSKNEEEGGGGSLVEIKHTKKVELKHWRMSGCMQEDSSGLKISGGTLVEVWNVTVEELQRTRGMAGLCSCEESGSKGGGVWVKTSGRSTMIFEKNKVGWCKTPGASGVGGGVYLWFGGLEAVYSMKDLEFSENSAYQGRDVYVVCEKPRLMMNAIYWSGTASSEESSEEQKRLWVVDKEPHEYVSTSLFEYLFASVAEIVFVNKDGWSESECGFEDTPCSSVETGLGQMEAAQSIIHIKKEAPLNGTVNRGSEPLTIRGNSEKGKMSVGSGAHLEVTEGVARTTLMLSNVVVALGEGLAEAELVELRCGMAVVIDSAIVDESAAGQGGGWRIASIHGGELDMSRVNIGKMDVIGEGELFLVCGGSLKMEDSCASGVCGRGNGMIAGKEGRIVEMLNVSIAECDFESGHVATIWSGIGNATISNCTFTDCSSMSDGACVSGKIGGDMEFCVEETEMSGCRCTKEGEGKGGGMLMDMRSGRVQKYLVRDVSFEGNDACFGRNVFVECLSLNESVTADRMVLRWGSAEDDGNGYVGADSTFELITLELFLVRYDGCVVAVSNAGYDMIGCGGEQHPCFSFWQGYRNLGADYEERKMVVENGCEIAGEFDVSAMTVESASAEVEAALSFSEQWADGQVEWVLGTSSKTVLSLLHLCVPQSLSEPHRTLICCAAPSGALNISHCSFSAEHAKCISFSLITVNGGHMTMSNCTMERVTGAAPPIVSCGDTAMLKCTIKEIKCSESKEGGAVHAVLKGDWRLVMSECKMSSCSCSAEEGKGVGYVEVSLNAAHMGVNAFVVARDLNSSITRATFGFKSSRGEEEGNDFVGRDGVFGETDLYRFVREYMSTVMHISSVGGYDVMRCGSAAEPCSTFWMGMQKLEKETKMRSVRVQGELRIADGFDLTNCSVECEGSAAGEDAACNMVFDMEGDSERDGVMCNKGELVQPLDSQMQDDFGERGRRPAQEPVQLCGDARGTLNVAGLEVCEVKFEGCVVQVGGGCDCVLENVVVNSIGMQSGCVLSAVDGAGAGVSMNSKIGVRVNGSKVSSVGAEGEKSSVVCVFELCKASGSQNGGAVLFGLNEEGRLTIRDSTLLQCSCSLDSGRGGGVCIRTKNHGDLPFLFSRVVFKGNAAHVGNDVFIECYRIDKQINESQFKMDVQEGVYNRINAIYGIDTVSTSPVDLVSLITVHYSSTVVVSSSSGKGANTRQGMFLTAVVDEESAAGGECDLRDVELKSRWETHSTISFDSIATQTREHVLSIDGRIRNTRAQKLIACRNSSLNVSHLAVQNTDIEADGISVADDVSMMLFNYSASHVRLRSGCMMVMDSQVQGQGQGQIQGEQSNDAAHNFSVLFSSFSNISSAAHKPSILSISYSNNCICVDNCLFDSCSSSSFVSEVSSSTSNIGTVMSFVSCTNIVCSSCVVDGRLGHCLLQGKCNDRKREFWNNKGSSAKYVSARRNVVCTEGGRVDVVSLKGGDGWKEDDSLWMVEEGCQMGGLASERKSAFFIPHLSEVETEETEDVGGMVKLRFKGRVLLPCSMGFEVVGVVGDVEFVEKHMFEEGDFESEREVRRWAEMEKVGWGGEEAEVRVSILFGNMSAPSHTEAFILQNRSEPKGNGDERTVEGGKDGKSFWPIIVIVMGIVLFVILIIAVISIVRWRNVKNEAEDLREIVNDNIRKDPKAFEMVTMEMSPEEQWRRAEREAEKKNDERIKKRVYEKSLGHSESSEHLLSESGSTEYILGRDSDKIPQWMLEKVDEEEDDISRKRTPSPSISSTSTTDTSDTESTFVRSESLYPTTSSMSNLVDAMACSSPHEKLIVDLRDSLFMLLHGKNEKKEMAIGTLQEREVTAAQILFWVANLALHSFDEMNNPLQSLTNLSPHIVLFSEHMVICIAMHSDCSSSDSDSSSISSSTVVTSTSDDDDDRDSLPSSAFEDEEDNRKECMRWKAPELLNGTTKHATKRRWGWVLRRGRVRGVVGGCLRYEAEDRMTLGDVKRELIKLFPPGAAVLTMTDAIGYEEESEEACSTSMAIMASGASMTSMTDIGNRSRDMKKQEEVKDEANGK